MNSPNAAIAEFEAQAGAKWLNIGVACDLSCKTRSELARSLVGIDSEDTSIIVSGSLARNEFTPRSDSDWSLLVDGFADANHQAVREKVASIINRHAEKRPGQEGTFGQLAFSHDLVHQIGGEDDTNRNTTRRLLLLLESAVVGRPDAYERVVKNVLQRYVLEDDGFVNASGKYASSAESVGRFWFREPSQVMIQGNFHGVEGAKAVGSSGNYTDFVVETFHGAIGDFPFRPEPIQDQRFMGPQHPGHPFDRLQVAAHGPEAPIVEKGPGPDRGFVPPEMSEGLLQIPGPGGGQLAGEQGMEFLPGSPAYPAASA